MLTVAFGIAFACCHDPGSLAQIWDWFHDDNPRAPHKALGMRSPADYRVAATLSFSW